MLDLFDIPQGSSANVKTFFGGNTTGWQPYEFPRGVFQVLIVAMGAGSGGGGGFTNITGSSDRGGGGGGGSGSMTRALFSRPSLPDVVYVLPGQGGAGGPGGNPATAGSAGTSSMVSAVPSSTNTYLYVNASGASGGGAGAATGSAAGGTGGAISAVTNMRLISAANWVSIAGQNGGVGGTATLNQTPAALQWGRSGIICSGGAGGASTTGTDTAGAGITGGFLVPSIDGGLATSSGNPGYCNFVPWLFTGGTGGGSDEGGGAGNGGNGSYGSGGGGAGGGTAGGTGGRGGDGLIMIMSW